MNVLLLKHSATIGRCLRLNWNPHRFIVRCIHSFHRQLMLWLSKHPCEGSFKKLLSPFHTDTTSASVSRCCNAHCYPSVTHLCHHGGTTLPRVKTPWHCFIRFRLSQDVAMGWLPAVNPVKVWRGLKGDYSLSFHTTILVVSRLQAGDGSEGILKI